MGTSRCILGLLLFVTMTATGMARADEPPAAITLIVPDNISMPAHMRDALEHLLLQSATLRRQCAAIGAASARARILLVPVRPVFAGVRARGAFSRTSTGEFHGRIEIPLSIDFPELVAHELEHVIEQIEGLDLRRLSRESGSGVEESHEGMFETVRAREAGRAAACEVDGGRCVARVGAPRARLRSANADQRAETGTFEPSHAARR